MTYPATTAAPPYYPFALPTVLDTFAVVPADGSQGKVWVQRSVFPGEQFLIVFRAPDAAVGEYVEVDYADDYFYASGPSGYLSSKSLLRLNATEHGPAAAAYFTNMSALIVPFNAWVRRAGSGSTSVRGFGGPTAVGTVINPSDGAQILQQTWDALHHAGYANSEITDSMFSLVRGFVTDEFYSDAPMGPARPPIPAQAIERAIRDGRLPAPKRRPVTPVAVRPRLQAKLRSRTGVRGVGSTPTARSATHPPVWTEKLTTKITADSVPEYGVFWSWTSGDWIDWHIALSKKYGTPEADRRWSQAWINGVAQIWGGKGGLVLQEVPVSDRSLDPRFHRYLREHPALYDAVFTGAGGVTGEALGAVTALLRKGIRSGEDLGNVALSPWVLGGLALGALAIITAPYLIPVIAKAAKAI